MSSYQVLFNGVTLDGCSLESVERSLAGALGIEHAKAKRLFSGRTVVLASQLSKDEALALQDRLEKVGAITRIKDLSPKSDLPLDYERTKSDATLRDLTAAHVDCPRCGHMQLESSHCTRCGVDIEALFRKRRKDELMMEKQLRDHRAAQTRQTEHDSATDEEQMHGSAVQALTQEAQGSANDAEKSGFFSRLFKRSA